MVGKINILYLKVVSLMSCIIVFSSCSSSPPSSEIASPASAVAASQLTEANAVRSRYLLFDDRLIEKKQNVRLAIGTVKKHKANPLMVQDKPWEPRYDNLYPNIVYDKDQKLYRCWYNPFIKDSLASKTPHEKRDLDPYTNHPDHTKDDQEKGDKVSYLPHPHSREFGMCYAVSRDGLKWTKPELNLVEFNGSKANNIFLRQGSHGGGILIDPRDSEVERRYKMFEGGIWLAGKEYEARPAVRFSKDGLRWSESIPVPEIEANGDTHNSNRWIPELKKYVTMTRIYDGQRVVGRTESSDYLKWSKATEVLRGDPDQQTYAMPFFRYADVYLGLVMIIRPKDPMRSGDRNYSIKDENQERVHCELAWSPDTFRWERINPGTPFIPTGSVKGTYDWGCIYAADAPIVMNDGIRIYYSGSDGHHRYWRDGSLCLATLRPDGWAGYEPVDSGQVALVVTKPLTWQGKLKITADSMGGSIQVTVMNSKDEVLSMSQLVKGEVTDQEINLSKLKQLEALIGQPVRLKFTLNKAKLYSFVLTS